MKIAKLFSSKRRSRCLLLLSSLSLLLPCFFVLSACSGGGDARQTQQAQMQEVVDKLSAIQAQLAQNGSHAHRHPTLSQEQLRAVFQPLGDVLAHVVDQQQVDRQQWMAMIDDVRRLSQVVEAGVAQKKQSELQALRGRLDEIDARLREQDQRSREAKAALIQALDAAGSRLDGLLKELDTAPEKPMPKVEAGKGKGEVKAKDKGEGKAGGKNEGATTPPTGGAGYPFLITFLAISVVLLVAWVVFFPNRARPVVPQIRYTARPDLAGSRRGEVSRHAPDLDHVEAAEAAETAEVAAVAAVAEAAEVARTLDGSGESTVDVDVQVETPGAAAAANGPQVVQLEVACGDPETAADRVAGYLSAEPRVLLHPAPDLETQDDTLALRFYMVPAVPEEQQSRIKAAIAALALENAPASAATGGGEKGNDLPAA